VLGVRVGIDIGGTKLHGVALDRSGAIAVQQRRSTPPTVTALIDDLVAMVGELAGPEGADSLGIGVPGLVGRDGSVRASAHLPEVRNTPLRRLVVDRLEAEGRELPVSVDNDATTATVAEWLIGAGRGVADLVMVTLGTGIGGGFVFDGRVYRGARGFAGEFGHAVIVVDGLACPCGRRGCWERYASGTALAAAAGRGSGEDAMDAVRAGEERALAAFEDFTRYVAMGLANLVNTVDPARIVLGGGMVSLGDELLVPVRRHLEGALYASDVRELPDVVAALLGEGAGAVGAALLGALSTAT